MSIREFDTFCQQAKLAIANRDWEGAREAYKKALKIKNDVPDVHQGLATVCFQLRDYESAAQHFREVTQLDPIRANAFVNLGAVLNVLEKYPEAVTALRRGIQLDPKRSEAFYNLGLVYRKQGQTKLAIEAYREAVRVNPNMADAHLNLGNIYVEQEEYRLALRYYRDAVQARPKWQKATECLAKVEAYLEREEAAQSAGVPGVGSEEDSGNLRYGVEIDPERIIELEKHGVILEEMHRAVKEAEVQGEQFLEIVEENIEPLIKELSACLLYPNRSVGALDDCIKTCETVLTNVKSIRQKLTDGIFKAQAMGRQLAKS